MAIDDACDDDGGDCQTIGHFETVIPAEEKAGEATSAPAK